jgi:HEAT repeat protein
MNLKTILTTKELKAKAKTELISKMLLNEELGVTELIKFAKQAKDAEKATCIEAIEYATKVNPKIATPACLSFIADSLTEKAPRVKWESARVIGNVAHLYPNKLDEAIKNLLVNTEYPGTVVRWSAAFALGEIIKLKTKLNNELVPAIESIVKREEENSIRKIYQAALKKVGCM